MSNPLLLGLNSWNKWKACDPGSAVAMQNHKGTHPDQPVLPGLQTNGKHCCSLQYKPCFLFFGA
jgi:hypothetical protein